MLLRVSAVSYSYPDGGTNVEDMYSMLSGLSNITGKIFTYYFNSINIQYY
jgi:hypothetical protein